jgi:hypothetical protein
MTRDNEAYMQLRALAAAASLEISGQREAQVDGVLQSWLVDANALSLKMSAAQFQTLTPVTVFAHPTFDDEAN